MRVFVKHRVSLTVFRAIIHRILSISLALSMITLVACVSQPKPVQTPQVEEAPAPVAEPAKPSASTEAAPSEPTVVPPIPLPAPPIAEIPHTTEDDTPVVEARPVMVTAQRDTYTVTHATTATKTDTPIMETPVSIQVIPQQVLKDQQAFRLEQALRNVSGVYMEPMTTFQGAGEVFSLRGFSIGPGGADSSNVYRNGLRLKSVWSGTAGNRQS
ncbi:MAG: TonB-dependent receptor plug domain-containing protein [Nitrospiraceae bacterium]